jgi:hypothetical protein
VARTRSRRARFFCFRATFSGGALGTARCFVRVGARGGGTAARAVRSARGGGPAGGVDFDMATVRCVYFFCGHQCIRIAACTQVVAVVVEAEPAASTAAVARCVKDYFWRFFRCGWWEQRWCCSAKLGCCICSALCEALAAQEFALSFCQAGYIAAALGACFCHFASVAEVLALSV